MVIGGVVVELAEEFLDWILLALLNQLQTNKYGFAPQIYVQVLL